MKVSELSGPELDYWVAKAEGLALEDYKTYRPSSDWSQGGPIIDKERIDFIWRRDGWVYAMRGAVERVGPTPLIAAMRAYVVSKLGETVDG